MQGKLFKVFIALLCTVGTGFAVFVILQCRTALKDLPELPPLPEEKVEAAAAPSAKEGKAEKGGESHEAKAEGGEGKKGEEGKEGKEGKEGHEAKGEGGEGKPAVAARAPANSIPLVSLDEIYVNVNSNGDAHTLGLKLELELFDEKTRGLLDQRLSAVKDAVIQASREQEFTALNSMAGKLYFKEYLVGRLNEYFRSPVVRDVHFSSFYLQ